MITESKINANYLSYIKRLEKYNCASEKMLSEIGETLKYCPFSGRPEFGCDYKGSMIDVVLNRLCTLAYSINETSFVQKHENMRVNVDMLMRVLLLQHISKAELFIPVSETWKIKKGLTYEFNDFLNTKLKSGQRSAYLCHKYGIPLTEEEYEAIISIDDIDDNKGNIFMSPLAIISKTVNMIVSVELRQEWVRKRNELEIGIER